MRQLWGEGHTELGISTLEGILWLSKGKDAEMGSAANIVRKMKSKRRMDLMERMEEDRSKAWEILTDTEGVRSAAGRIEDMS